MLLLALLPLFAAGLDMTAKKTRAVPPAGQRKARVVSVADACELWQAYAGLGLRGRLLLHVGRHLHFVQVQSNEIYRLDQGDLAGLDLDAAYRSRVDHRNYLWLAARSGYFRRIHYLLDEAAFMEKMAEAGISGAQEFSVSDSGFQRVLSLHPPSGNEAPIVQVDVSWMELHTPEDVIAMLRKLPIKPDVIILSCGGDDPERTTRARERMARLGELINDAGF